MKESEARKKNQAGNRNLKASAFGWYLKPKGLTRSPRETIKATPGRKALYLLRSVGEQAKRRRVRKNREENQENVVSQEAKGGMHVKRDQ